MNNLIITTTNSIQDAKIEKYLGVVTANQVIGTNVFSDFVASFSDFFGGMSGTYRRQLSSLYKNTISSLEDDAKRLGANAVLGVHIDFDEISGKGKSMFMVSISGTAVKCSLNSSNTLVDKAFQVDQNELEVAMYLKTWGNASEDRAISDEDWKFIISNNLASLAEPIIKCYLHQCETYKNNETLIEPLKEHIREYLDLLSYEDKVDVVYSLLRKQNYFGKQIIREQKLFSSTHVIGIIEEGNPQLAAEILVYDKSSYSSQDLEDMHKLVSLFDNLPDKGHYEVVSGGIFSSAGRKYICPKGHKNDEDVIFCEHIGCDLNIKGLDSDHVNMIEKFKQKVEVLDSIFKSREE